MRRAFSLVEVLVASSIASIVALALLQNHSNNIKLIQSMSKKYHAKEEFSLVLLNADVLSGHGSLLLYDLVGKRFNIQDDKTLSFLKSEKFFYDNEKFSSHSLLDMKLEESVLGEQYLLDIRLVMNKLSFKSNIVNAQAYLLYLQ